MIRCGVICGRHVLLAVKHFPIFISSVVWLIAKCVTVRLKPDGTRWRTGGEVKGKLANGVGSQRSPSTSEHGVSSITTADAHTSAASNLLNWRPQRFKWTRPFRRKTKSGFCACAITYQTRYTSRKWLRFAYSLGRWNERIIIHLQIQICVA